MSLQSLTGEFIFWFHSYDVLHESRASTHVGKGSQNDAGDAKIWLEPKIEVGQSGRTLSRSELQDVISIIERNLDGLQEAWNDHKRKTECQTTKWYDIAYPASAHTFPREALLHRVHFDDDFMHLELTNGRKLSVPLWWIPTLHNAPPEEREKYEISQDRKMIIWDPDNGSINDEVRIDDYLASHL